MNFTDYNTNFDNIQRQTSSTLRKHDKLRYKSLNISAMFESRNQWNQDNKEQTSELRQTFNAPAYLNLLHL